MYSVKSFSLSAVSLTFALLLFLRYGTVCFWFPWNRFRDFQNAEGFGDVSILCTIPFHDVSLAARYRRLSVSLSLLSLSVRGLRGP